MTELTGKCFIAQYEFLSGFALVMMGFVLMNIIFMHGSAPKRPLAIRLSFREKTIARRVPAELAADYKVDERQESRRSLHPRPEPIRNDGGDPVGGCN